MKIYTKTGDMGETGLWGGQRISKADARLHAYGTVDELNAVLGVVRSGKIDPELNNMLGEIQNLLFVLGSDLATPADTVPAIDRISLENTEELEHWIDRLEKDLPPLKQFIIPGGSSAAAFLHLARTVCRRAERWAVAAVGQEKVYHNTLIFLNRLSDFLFVAARKSNLSEDKNDIRWDNPRKNKKTDNP